MIIGFCDTETTGKDPNEDRIIEFAIVIYDDEQNHIKNYEVRVCPGRKIHADAIAVHHISDSDVAFEKKFEELVSEIVEVIESCDLIVGHNFKKFDAEFLQAEVQRAGSTLKMPPIIDTMLDGRGCTGDGKVPSLQELCWSTGVEYDPAKAHAALYDCEVLALAFYAARQYGMFLKPT